MSSKNEPQLLQEDFQFFLTHSDIVTMMNDEDVALDDGNVDESQVFEVWIEKANGTRIYLRDMQATDQVLFQFSKFTQESTPVEYTQINVIP